MVVDGSWRKADDRPEKLDHGCSRPVADAHQVGQAAKMRLKAISANQHVYEGRATGKPIRLRLTFDPPFAIRLSIPGDGANLRIDDQLLDPTLDMNEYGQIVESDVTESLFLNLANAEVVALLPLLRGHRLVGLRMDMDQGREFNFWVDDDELFWGDQHHFTNHDWLDGLRPTSGEPIKSLASGS